MNAQGPDLFSDHQILGRVVFLKRLSIEDVQCQEIGNIDVASNGWMSATKDTFTHLCCCTGW